MTEENTTPETQDTSEEKLIFGKYKTPEEAEQAHKEMERKNAEISEALDREQRLNALLGTEDRQTTPEPASEPAQYAPVPLANVFDEEQAKAVQTLLEQQRQQISQETARTINRTVTTMESRRAAEEQFFALYPNLKPFKREVDEEARRLATELGDRVQKVPFETLSGEVAKRVTEHLTEQKKRLSKSALHLETGSPSEPTVEVVKEDAPTSVEEAERTKEYFDDEVREFNKKKFKPLRG